jgi:hypothetical protein
LSGFWGPLYRGKIEDVTSRSTIAQKIITIPGFGRVAKSELAAEIGAEGKRHNQAVRALGRHLCRMIFKMLKQEKDYEIRK